MQRHMLNLLTNRNQVFNAKERQMNDFSSKIIHLMDDIIDIRSKWNIEDRQYHLDYDELSQDEKERLSAQLLKEDIDLRQEALGDDNIDFERKMLPSLIKVLSQSYNKDCQYDFIYEWVNGITNHMERTLDDLLKSRLSIYNFNNCEEN